jgi:hypothetical protein
MATAEGIYIASLGSSLCIPDIVSIQCTFLTYFLSVLLCFSFTLLLALGRSTSFLFSCKG